MSGGEATRPVTRRCPACRTSTDQLLCPKDRTPTLISGLPWVEASELRRGRVIANRYRIEEVLGRGAFGVVFSAIHLGTGQPVAVKVLGRSAEEDDELLARFFREAKVTASLQHPNTVRAFDFGQDDTGVVFIAMERLNGRSLRERLSAGGALPERETLRLAIDVLRSLAEAHAVGLVHRDLKPENVFLHEVPGNEPIVKVLDFGIAKLRGNTITAASALLCTPSYASPEVITKEGALDGRSDLYSLGVVLYELITGRLPFEGDTPLATLYMHVQRPVPDLRRDPRVRCSDRLAAVVMRALAKNPAGRFPDAAAMRAVLEACAPEAETSSEVLDAGPTSPDFVLEPTAPAVARPAATVLRTLPSAALDRPRWRAAVIVLSCVAMLAVAAAALIVDRVPEVPAATPLATPAPTVPVPVAVPAAPAPPAAVPVVPVVPVGIPQPEPNPPPETRPPDPTPQKQVEEERDVHRKRAPRPGEKKGSALEVEI